MCRVAKNCRELNDMRKESEKHVAARRIKKQIFILGKSQQKHVHAFRFFFVSKQIFCCFCLHSFDNTFANICSHNCVCMCFIFLHYYSLWFSRLISFCGFCFQPIFSRHRRRRLLPPCLASFTFIAVFLR